MVTAVKRRWTSPIVPLCREDVPNTSSVCDHNTAQSHINLTILFVIQTNRWVVCDNMISEWQRFHNNLTVQPTLPWVMMSFPEKGSFVPPRVYGGSLQRASSSAGEMSVRRKANQFWTWTKRAHSLPFNQYIMTYIKFHTVQILCKYGKE